MDAINAPMQNILTDLERHLLRGSRETARVLGTSYSNYVAMRAGQRRIPAYIDGHARAIMALPAETLNAIVRSRLDG